MKTILIALALSLFAALSPAKADDFNINWSFIDSTGTTSGSCSWSGVFTGC